MNWTIFLLMLPHLKPKCISYFWPEVYRGLDVLRVISLLVICVLLFRKKKLPSLPSILLGLLESWICLVTLITHGDFVETCSLAVSVMAIVLLVDLYSDQMKTLITSLMLNYEWIVYVNLLTVLKDPQNGIARDPRYQGLSIYFFGSDNWFMYLCIPAVCLALLYIRLQLCEDSPLRKMAGVFRAVCLIVASYVTVLICWSATAVVAMATLAVVLLGWTIPGLRRIFNFPVVLLGGVGVNLAIVVFRVTERVPFITSFVRNSLKKVQNLSGRTEIWASVQSQIKDNLWLGIGTPKEGYLIGENVMDHMHNQIFDLLVQGGLPALLLFAAVLLVVGVQLTRHRHRPAAGIMVVVMAGLLMMCIPEVCRHGSIFLLFPLAWYVPQVETICLKSEV